MPGKPALRACTPFPSRRPLSSFYRLFLQPATRLQLFSRFPVPASLNQVRSSALSLVQFRFSVQRSGSGSGSGSGFWWCCCFWSIDCYSRFPRSAGTSFHPFLFLFLYTCQLLTILPVPAHTTHTPLPHPHLSVSQYWIIAIYRIRSIDSVPVTR